jgi:hypothetical protein
MAVHLEAAAKSDVRRTFFQHGRHLLLLFQEVGIGCFRDQ